VATDTAVASAEDSDGDNYLDAAELEVGLDPGDPDTDDDGVADGDGLSDGQELFATNTDPLIEDLTGAGP